MIVLRLDKSALMHLIETQPEEFKLELSRAVLAEASRTLVRNIVPKQAKEIVEDAAAAEIGKQVGEVLSTWPKKKVRVNATLMAEIEGLAEKQARLAVRTAFERFETVLEEKAKVYLGLVEDAVERRFSTILDEETEKEIQRRVVERLKAAANM